MFGLKKENPYFCSTKENEITELKITDPNMNVNLFKEKQGKEKEDCLFLSDSFGFFQGQGGWNRPLAWFDSFGELDFIGCFQQQDPVISMSMNKLLHC